MGGHQRRARGRVRGARHRAPGAAGRRHPGARRLPWRCRRSGRAPCSSRSGPRAARRRPPVRPRPLRRATHRRRVRRAAARRRGPGALAGELRATVVGAIRPVVRRDLARRPQPASADAPRVAACRAVARDGPRWNARAEWRTIAGRIRHRGQATPARAPWRPSVTETLDRVKTYQQFIGGQWVDSASGETHRGREPGRRHRRRARPGLGPGGRGPRGRCGGGRVRDLGPDDAPDPQPRAAQDRRHPRRERRRARPPRVQPDRQADPRGDRRDDHELGPVPVLRGRLPRPGGPRGHRVPRRPHVDGPPRPGRRRRLDRALELPAVHGGLEARPGARDRQHGRAQAVGPDAAVRAAVRGARRRRAAGRRAQRPVGLRRARWATCWSSHPKVRMVSITGDTVDRQAHRGARRGDRQAAPPRAGRQGAGDRVRRRRHRARRRDAQERELLERRPGLHRGLPRHRRARPCTTSSSRRSPTR